MKRWLVLLVFASGCGFGYFISFDLEDGDRRALSGTDLEVQLSGETIAIASTADHGVLVREPVERKPRLALPLEGRACSLNVVRAREVGTTVPRTWSVHLELVCEDGSAPGSPNTMAGSRVLVALPWALPGLVLGIFAGLLIRRARNRKGRVLALDTGLAILAAAGTAITLPVMMFESWFRLTYAVAFVGYAFGGALLGHAWSGRKGPVIAAIIGGLIGLIGSTLFFSASRHWSFERALVPMFAALMTGWGIAAGTQKKRQR